MDSLTPDVDELNAESERIAARLARNAAQRAAAMAVERPAPPIPDWVQILKRDRRRELKRKRGKRRPKGARRVNGRLRKMERR